MFNQWHPNDDGGRLFALEILRAMGTTTADVAKTGESKDTAMWNALAKMPPAQRARSDSYFEGGYWLQLWDFLITLFVMWWLLRFGWSARMRNLARAQMLARLS